MEIQTDTNEFADPTNTSPSRGDRQPLAGLPDQGRATVQDQHHSASHHQYRRYAPTDHEVHHQHQSDRLSLPATPKRTRRIFSHAYYHPNHNLPPVIDRSSHRPTVSSGFLSRALAQRIFLTPGRCFRDRFARNYRYFIPRQMRPAPIAQFITVRRFVVKKLDKGTRCLAPFFMGLCHHRHAGDGRVFIKRILNLDRRDILAT